MLQIIRNRKQKFFVMIDHGDLLHRLKLFWDCRPRTTFNAFYTHWIATLDASEYFFIDCGYKLAIELMKRKHHKVQDECLIPVELQWYIGLNDRSHQHLHKSIDLRFLRYHYNTGDEHDVHLVDLEIRWSYTQHFNIVLPHCHQFGITPRLIGLAAEVHLLTELTALMHLARQEIVTLLARDFIARTLDSTCLTIILLKSFTIG